MRYFVKRGYSYVDPVRGDVFSEGKEVVNPDKTQTWKLTNELVQEQDQDIEFTKKKMTNEMYVAENHNRSKQKTDARRALRNKEKKSEGEKETGK